MGKRKAKKRSNSVNKTSSYYKRFQVKFARRRAGAFVSVSVSVLCFVVRAGGGVMRERGLLEFRIARFVRAEKARPKPRVFGRRNAASKENRLRLRRPMRSVESARALPLRIESFAYRYSRFSFFSPFWALAIFSLFFLFFSSTKKRESKTVEEFMLTQGVLSFFFEQAKRTTRRAER